MHAGDRQASHAQAGCSGRDHQQLLCRSYSAHLSRSRLAGTRREGMRRPSKVCCAAPHPLSGPLLAPPPRAEFSRVDDVVMPWMPDELARRPQREDSAEPSTPTNTLLPPAPPPPIIAQASPNQHTSLGRLQLMLNSSEPPTEQEANLMLLGKQHACHCMHAAWRTHTAARLHAWHTHHTHRHCTPALNATHACARPRRCTLRRPPKGRVDTADADHRSPPPLTRLRLDVALGGSVALLPGARDARRAGVCRHARRAVAGRAASVLRRARRRALPSDDSRAGVC